MNSRCAVPGSPVEFDSALQDEAESATIPERMASLDAKVNALLPPQYQFCFDSVSPTSMGSAGLKFGPDGRVAWDEIWTHFCDLALAGGPPHRGSLLEAPTREEVESEPAGYQLVHEEIVRGIRLTTGLLAAVGPESGWVTLRCQSEEMAAWLLRAVMAENVFTRRCQDALQVPAGPWFRLAKEVKNVVVALAKCCHYWQDHLSVSQRSAAAALFNAQETAALLEPPSRPEALARAAEYADVAERVGRTVERATGLSAARSVAPGWVGVQLPDERTAAWFVRSTIAENILARREANLLFLPLRAPSPEGEPFEVVTRLVPLHRIFICRIQPGH